MENHKIELLPIKYKGEDYLQVIINGQVSLITVEEGKELRKAIGEWYYGLVDR
jgi:hypothetical protein